MIQQLLLLASASFALFAGVAAAEDQKELKLQSYGDIKNAKLYEYDTAVPAAPALGMVENTPELSLSAPFGPDFSKEVVLTGEKPGFALALRPYWASGAGLYLSPDNYQKDTSWFMRTAARTVLSAAGAPVVTDSSRGLGAAVGLSTELLDKADPRFNDAHLTCLGNSSQEVSNIHNTLVAALDTDPAKVAEAKVIAITALGSTPPPAELQAADSISSVQMALPHMLRGVITAWKNQQVENLSASQAAETKYKARVARCFKRAKLAAENTVSLQVAGGAGWASDTYSLSNMKSTGGKAWAAFRLPLGAYQDCRLLGKSTETIALEASEIETHKGGKCLSPRGNLTAFAHYSSDDKVTVASATKSAKVSQFGVVLSRKNAGDTWSISASAAWNERNYEEAGLATDKFERYAIAYAQKVTGKIWFEATFGQTSGVATAKDESYGLVRFVMK